MHSAAKKRVKVLLIVLRWGTAFFTGPWLLGVGISMQLVLPPSVHRCNLPFFLDSLVFLADDDGTVGARDRKETTSKRKKAAAFRGTLPQEQRPFTPCFTPRRCTANPYLRDPVISGLLAARFSPFSFLFEEAAGSALQKETKYPWRVMEGIFFSLSLSALGYFFLAAPLCCISCVVECKLLRTRGWFTANWFVNVVFTSPETPIFLPFLVCSPSLFDKWREFGSRRERTSYLRFLVPPR